MKERIEKIQEKLNGIELEKLDNALGLDAVEKIALNTRKERISIISSLINALIFQIRSGMLSPQAIKAIKARLFYIFQLISAWGLGDVPQIKDRLFELENLIEQILGHKIFSIKTLFSQTEKLANQINLDDQTITAIKNLVMDPLATIQSPDRVPVNLLTQQDDITSENQAYFNSCETLSKWSIDKIQMKPINFQEKFQSELASTEKMAHTEFHKTQKAEKNKFEDTPSIIDVQIE